MEAKKCGVESILLWTMPGLCVWGSCSTMQRREGDASPVILSPSPLHSCVTGLVDNDRLPGLVNVMVHAEVGSYPVQQHPMV